MYVCFVTSRGTICRCVIRPAQGSAPSFHQAPRSQIFASRPSSGGRYRRLVTTILRFLDRDHSCPPVAHWMHHLPSGEVQSTVNKNTYYCMLIHNVLNDCFVDARSNGRRGREGVLPQWNRYLHYGQQPQGRTRHHQPELLSNVNHLGLFCPARPCNTLIVFCHQKD